MRTKDYLVGSPCIWIKRLFFRFQEIQLKKHTQQIYTTTQGLNQHIEMTYHLVVVVFNTVGRCDSLCAEGYISIIEIIETEVLLIL